ncbi:MAG: HD domain-containing protein [Thermocladium sp.]
MELEELPRVIDALCRLPRIGWVNRGISDPETVCSHTLLTAYIAINLAKASGLDAGKAALLALIHDVAEHKLGDVVREVREMDMDYWRELEQGVANELGLGKEFQEYSEGISGEARVVMISDKLATLLRACRYREQGEDVESLITYYSKAVKSMLSYLNGDAAAQVEAIINSCLHA